MCQSVCQTMGLQKLKRVSARLQDNPGKSIKMGMVASLASKKEIKPCGPLIWVKLYFSFPSSLFLKLKITHSIPSCD